MFNCLYNKKQAIDFLLSKTTVDIKYLFETIDPNSNTITLKDIIDTQECVGIFNEMKEINDKKAIFEFLKEKMKDNEIIKRFINFSQIYASVIDLNQNFDFSNSLFEKVQEKIINANFFFYHDHEEFFYHNDNNSTTLDELKKLKNKIHVNPKFKNISENSDSGQIKDKYKKLLFFIFSFKYSKIALLSFIPFISLKIPTHS